MKILIPFLFSLFVLANCVTDDVEPLETKRLLGYWPLNEGQGKTISDLSVHQQHGSIVGRERWGLGHFHEKAYLGNGTSYIEIPDNTLDSNFPGQSLGKFSSSFSVTAWIKVSLNSYQMIVAKDKEGERSFNFSLSKEGTLKVQIYSYTNSIDFTGVQPITEQQGWRHVAMVYEFHANETSSVTTYIDGKEDKTADFVIGPIKATPTSFRIGAREFSPTVINQFQGLMNDIRIYSRILTESEIQTFMNLK